MLLRRFAVVVCVIFLSIPPAIAAQSPSSPVSSPQKPQAAPAKAVVDAEAAIAKQDWVSAEKILDTWLVADPEDARALFDAGYAADAQNRQDDAAGLYQRSVKADSSSFEAQL